MSLNSDMNRPRTWEGSQELGLHVARDLFGGLGGEGDVGKVGQALDRVDLPRWDRDLGKKGVVVSLEGTLGAVERDETLVDEEDLPAPPESASRSRAREVDRERTTCPSANGRRSKALQPRSWACCHRSTRSRTVRGAGSTASALGRQPATD